MGQEEEEEEEEEEEDHRRRRVVVNNIGKSRYGTERHPSLKVAGEASATMRHHQRRVRTTPPPTTRRMPTRTTSSRPRGYKRTRSPGARARSWDVASRSRRARTGPCPRRASRTSRRRAIDADGPASPGGVAQAKFV